MLSLIGCVLAAPRAWQHVGCPDRRPGAFSGSMPAAICAGTEQRAGTRCCPTAACSLSACESVCSAGNSGGVTRAVAEAECAARGQRLCRLAELQVGRCCRRGCGLDRRQVWTADGCDSAAAMPPDGLSPLTIDPMTGEPANSSSIMRRYAPGAQPAIGRRRPRQQRGSDALLPGWDEPPGSGGAAPPHAFVVNLPSRTDRRRAIEAQMSRVGWPKDRLHFVDGIQGPFNGMNGCFGGHIAALDAAQARLDAVGDEVALVFEDDWQWKSKSALSALQAYLHKSGVPWDVLLLACNGRPAVRVRDALKKSTREARHNGSRSVAGPQLHRVVWDYCLSASGYAIKRDYIATLRTLWQHTLAERLRQKHRANTSSSSDVVWQQLQCRDRWFLAAPMLGYQAASFSNIENRMVDYGL